MAYDLKEELRKEDRVTVVPDKDRYQFVPSNPWLAVNIFSMDAEMHL